MERQLRQAGIKGYRMRALNTKVGTPVHSIHDQKIFGAGDNVKRMLQRTPGAIGCYYSQVEVMRRAMTMNQHAFVMEDDLVFCSDILARLEYIERFMDAHEWDVFWLGATFHVNPAVWHTGRHPELPGSAIGRDAECTDDPRILRTYGAFCTYAYIVNVHSIEKILQLLKDTVAGSIGIDYSFIKIQPFLKSFAFVPGCIKQMDNQSDIGNGMTIFSGFSKLGPYWFQDRMEEFNPETFNWAEAKLKV
jgi:GR25 family glycosyltransferase involved in LPS biosynthesis